jgi:YihY family inner membrane protein
VGGDRTRVETFDAFQQRHRPIAFVIAVVYKAVDDRALFLAALVTYYAFVSLFPLLLLFVSIMGFVLHNDPHLRQSIVNATLSDVPGIGSILRDNIEGFKGSAPGIAIGVVGLLYGGMGAMQASQYAFNTIYAVPRYQQPNPFGSRLRSLGLLVILGTAILVSTGMTVAIANARSVSSQLGGGLTIAGYGVNFVISVALFSAAFSLLTGVDLRTRDVVAGGVISGAVWQVLQTFGSRYVVHQVKHANALYGVFGVVLASIAWIYLVSLVVMLSAEINVVRQKRLWPRSLEAPFRDGIDPTAADMAAYSSYTRAVQFKSWQRIDVDFEPPDLTGPAGADGSAGVAGGSEPGSADGLGRAEVGGEDGGADGLRGGSGTGGSVGDGGGEAVTPPV